MKSPFTGGDAALCHEKQSFEFRKDNFEIVRIQMKSLLQLNLIN